MQYDEIGRRALPTTPRQADPGPAEPAANHRPVVIDGRNLYDPAKMADLGFTYHSIGRQSIEQTAPQRVGEFA